MIFAFRLARCLARSGAMSGAGLARSSGAVWRVFFFGLARSGFRAVGLARSGAMALVWRGLARWVLWSGAVWRDFVRCCEILVQVLRCCEILVQVLRPHGNMMQDPIFLLTRNPDGTQTYRV